MRQPQGGSGWSSYSSSPWGPRTWKDNHLNPGLGSARGAGGHTEVEAGVGSRDGRDEQCGDVCALCAGLPHGEKGSKAAWQGLAREGRQRGTGQLRAGTGALGGHPRSKAGG